MQKNKKTINDIIKMKQDGQKIAILTAYDYVFGSLLDKAGIDIILVGDSVGNTVLGYDSTTPVTMRDMLHHAKAVRKGVTRALLVVDMPFMSFNVSKEDAIRKAGRFVKEARVDAVKIEGGSPSIVETAKAIIDAGIPVMGHVGLTPQTAGVWGGFKVQGRVADKAQELIKQAIALEKAGCFSLVLECIPEQLAELVTNKINIPTISCGAGIHCDGQVLVINDVLGLSGDFKPKFVKKYVDISHEITKACKEYIKEVKEGLFPSSEHSFKMKDDELAKIKDNV